MNWPFPVRARPAAPGSFEAVVLPHLDAAHRLARWLVRDPVLADDVVQDAALRAFRHIETVRTGEGRAWFLRILRNVAYDALAKRKASQLDPIETAGDIPDGAPGPAESLARAQDHARLARALAALPPELRECLVLRELEGFSYKDIAETVGIPTGTVMSRLWRARQMLMETAKEMTS